MKKLDINVYNINTILYEKNCFFDFLENLEKKEEKEEIEK